MITLKGRTLTANVDAQVGKSLLDHALAAGVDWQFNCSRGTCAKCRCIVQEGADLLSEPNDAEWDRLGAEELDEGFRLGCQAAVMKPGDIKAVNRTYF
ncbi:ferredoxin [Cohnella kolymensis]|uniref:Ferredoxin n=1 Tax=Cohnella kolymensis TaxID=1590652 RepID=A0ABR5A1B7_9BACL|nr:2Fe-2S iron-sulfur cluster-binding protein [Cohnella kolymensis]KIL34846.1 ferredoxin [Cohnella kolymensis]